MNLLLFVAAVWPIVAGFAWALCAAAGRADEQVEGWRNRGES